MIGFLYDLLFTAPILVLTSFIYSMYTGQDEKRLFVYLIICLTGVVMIVIKHVGTKWKVAVSAFVLLMPIAFFTVRSKETRAEFWTQNRWMLLIMLLGAAVGALMMTVCRFVWVKHLLGVAEVAVLIVSLYNGLDVKVIDTAASAFFILTATAETVQKRWKKKGGDDIRGHVCQVAPFILAGVIAMSLIPAPDDPYDWKEFRVITERASELYTYITQTIFKNDPEGFTDVFSSFSNDGELHPDITMRDVRVIVYKTPPFHPGSVYLGGPVCNTFDGHVWETTLDNEDDDKLIDAVEIAYAVELYDPTNYSDYYRIVNTSVKYTLFKTKYIFTPAKTIDVNTQGAFPFSHEGDQIVFDGFHGLGTNYEISFVAVNRGKECFTEFANTPKEYSEESFNRFIKNSPVARFKTVTYDDLIAHRERIYEDYLPETKISDRAQAYIDEVTKDADTNYGKLQAISESLSDYEYTKHPGEYSAEIDSDEEFLDYFLFEGKRGYCSYFATAFVIIARSQGIPCRYVQGFSSKVDSNSKNEIKSKDAHAWPEAYIDGVGWVVFEPTGGGSASSDAVADSWETKSENLFHFEQYINPNYGANANDLPDAGESKEVSEVEKKDKKVVWTNYLILFGPIAAAFILAGLFALFDRQINRGRMSRLKQRDYLKSRCVINLKMMKHLGYLREPGETLEEFYKRAYDMLPEACVAFIPVYEKVLYSECDITEEDSRTVELAGKFLYEQLGFFGKTIMWTYR